MDDDVIVVGGGPVGLLLAGELKLAGVSVTVLETRAEPSEVEKATSINARSVRTLTRRGLAERLREVSAATGQSGVGGTGSRVGGWFGGTLLHVEPGFELPPAAMVPQPALEKLLAQWVSELGVPVLRGHTVTDLAQDGAGVTVTVEAAGGHHPRRAHYLVGCDGARSTVRRLTGIPFPGTDPTCTVVKTWVTLDHPDRLPPGQVFTGTGFYMYNPKSGLCVTMEFDGGHGDRKAEITTAEVERRLRTVSGADVRVLEARNAGRFTDTTRQASQYVLGRVLLAGDAAHVNPPFGGQGLNLGLQDAANLGWKLAATTQGWAPAGLLDTYAAERQQVATEVLALTRAQGAMMRTDPHSAALRELFGRLIRLPEVSHMMLNLLQSMNVRYDFGGSPHPLVGSHLEGVPGLDELMRRPRPVLVDSTGSADLRTVAEGWSDRVDVHELPSTGGVGAMLVRPDGYVVWAADASGDIDREGLRTALERWFGRALVLSAQP